MSIILANKFKKGKFRGTFLLSNDPIDIEGELVRLREEFVNNNFYIDEELSIKTNGFFAISNDKTEKISVIIKNDVNEFMDINSLLNVNSN